MAGGEFASEFGDGRQKPREKKTRSRLPPLYHTDAERKPEKARGFARGGSKARVTPTRPNPTRTRGSSVEPRTEAFTSAPTETTQKYYFRTKTKLRRRRRAVPPSRPWLSCMPYLLFVCHCLTRLSALAVDRSFGWWRSNASAPLRDRGRRVPSNHEGILIRDHRTTRRYPVEATRARAPTLEPIVSSLHAERNAERDVRRRMRCVARPDRPAPSPAPVSFILTPLDP